jgi:molecular chaperone DnaK (HSP70)
VYGQKKELERLVRDDLVAQGKIGPGEDISAASAEDVAKSAAASAAESGLAAAAVADLVTTKVTNVTSRGFGIFAEDQGRAVAAFLARQNDKLPVAVSQTFYTLVDDQTEVDIQVFEQNTSVESNSPEDNKVIVEGAISGIPTGHPRGTPVEVTFEMQRDQTIQVTARHPGSADPLVLEVAAGVGSEAMLLEESAKLSRLERI